MYPYKQNYERWRSVPGCQPVVKLSTLSRTNLKCCMSLRENFLSQREFQTKELELGQSLLVVNYKDCLLLINC